MLRDDELYFFAGVNASFLRGGLPVVPLAGLIWTPNKQWHAVAMVPEPRIVYSPNNQWDFWLGGELLGGSFRLDDHDEFQGIPHVAKLSGTQVDYMEYRTGLGMVYSPTDNICFDLGAGYAVERAFKFHRAGENYRTDPAPYFPECGHASRMGCASGDLEPLDKFLYDRMKFFLQIIGEVSLDENLFQQRGVFQSHTDSDRHT